MKQFKHTFVWRQLIRNAFVSGPSASKLLNQCQGNLVCHRVPSDWTAGQMVKKTSRAKTHSSQQNSGMLQIGFVGRGVPKSIFVWSGSISVFRTHKYFQIAQNFATNPMGPRGLKPTFPGKQSLNFLIGVRIFLGICDRHAACPLHTFISVACKGLCMKSGLPLL